MYNPELINQKDSFTGYHTKQSLLAYLNYKFSGSLEAMDLTVLIIDLDKFKEINDRYGHLVGDEALKHFVKVLNSALNGKHFVARYGGDEFVVVVDENAKKREGSSELQGTALAQQIVAKLKTMKFSFSKKSMTLRCSIGIARYPLDGKNDMAILAAADESLYFVKKHGRGGIATHNQLKDFSSKEKFLRISRTIIIVFIAGTVLGTVYLQFDQMASSSRLAIYNAKQLFSRYVLGKIVRMSVKKNNDFMVLTSDLEMNGKILHEDTSFVIFSLDPWTAPWHPARASFDYRTILSIPSNEIVYINREVYPKGKYIFVVIELKANRSIKGWLVKEDASGVDLSLVKIADDFDALSTRTVSYMMPLKVPLKDIKTKFKL